MARISRMRAEPREFGIIRAKLCEFVNGAEGVSDIEGKAAAGSGERAGKQASFKFVSGFFWNVSRAEEKRRSSAALQNIRLSRRSLVRRRMLSALPRGHSL